MKKFKKKKIISMSIVVGVLIVIIVLNLLIWKDTSKLKTFSDLNYVFSYDNSWKVEDKEASKIILTHQKDGKITIQSIELDEKNKYLALSDLKEKIVYTLEQANESYKMLEQESIKLTKNQYDGYKILFENNDTEVIFNVFKKSDKLIVIIYEASKEVFDILLDSVNNIIYNFNFNEETFAYSKNLEINDQVISYQENKEVANLLKKTSNYEIASNNYLVNYQIPSNFKSDNFSSNTASYTLEDLEKGSITLSTAIFNRNIYAYLEKSSNASLYKKYDSYKSDKDYSNYQEALAKLGTKRYNYIYKNSYYYNNATTLNDKLELITYKRLEENIELIYELNKNHIFVITIKSKDMAIPKELVEMIKVNSSKNYANYYKEEKENGYIIANLKEYTSTAKDKYYNIKLKLKDSYFEKDLNQNVYETRYFSKEYNREKDLYDYEITYTLSKAKIEKQIDNMNKLFLTDYGSYQKLKKDQTIKINDKNFVVYSGGYTNSLNGEKYYLNKKILFYQIGNNYLTITIDGNGKQITDEIIKEVTDISVIEEKI